MIPVIWYNGCRGNWDHGTLEDVFDKHPDVFIQHNIKENIPVDRAIVIVAGRPKVKELRSYLDTIDKGVVILTSEEDGFFDWQRAIPAHLDTWTQYYTASKSLIRERLLLGAPNRIRNYKLNSHLEKKYLWSFIGQNQNPHRNSCIQVLNKLPDGFLHITDLFGGEGDKGMDYQSYLDICCQSKFVLCPSGSMSADSFRVYEAILCGAIPIADKRCPRDPEGFDYWEAVYPGNGLISVDFWGHYVGEYMQQMDVFPPPTWYNQYLETLEKKLLHAAN